MKLHYSPRSPFVRKVMVAAHELGLADRLHLVRTVVRMDRPNAELLADNPLSKIPTLVLDDGSVLFDSLTICDYLDHLAGTPRLIPAPGPARWAALTQHALANGLLDLLILWRNEREKPQPFAPWLESFARKAEASLARLESLAPGLALEAPGIGEITIACALSYLDFRFADLPWRSGRPALAAWHADFCRRPSMIATEVVDDA